MTVIGRHMHPSASPLHCYWASHSPLSLTSTLLLGVTFTPQPHPSASPLHKGNQRKTTFTEIDEHQRKCLVQSMIDTTAKNCNPNYSGFSRFSHGPVVNKFYCPARYFYLPRDVGTCLNLSPGSTVARYLLRGNHLSGGRHSPVTPHTM